MAKKSTNVSTTTNRSVVKKDNKPAIKPFDKETEDGIKQLLSIADKSGVLDNPRHKEMNQDFVAIQNNIETTRNFNLKAMKVFGLSKKIVNIDIKDLPGKKLMVTVIASVGKGEVWNEALGACSTEEVESKREGNARIIHDMVAIAETRALKRAMEERIGLPIINMVIKKLFGGYQTYAYYNQIKGTDYDDVVNVEFKEKKGR